jgi:hypothetical protein
MVTVVKVVLLHWGAVVKRCNRPNFLLVCFSSVCPRPVIVRLLSRIKVLAERGLCRQLPGWVRLGGVGVVPPPVCSAARAWVLRGVRAQLLDVQRRVYNVHPL